MMHLVSAHGGCKHPKGRAWHMVRARDMVPLIISQCPSPHPQKAITLSGFLIQPHPALETSGKQIRILLGTWGQQG